MMCNKVDGSKYKLRIPPKIWAYLNEDSQITWDV